MNLHADSAWKKSMFGNTAHFQMRLYRKMRDGGRKYYKSVLIIMMFRVVLACCPGACVISEIFLFRLLLPIKLGARVERLRYSEY